MIRLDVKPMDSRLRGILCEGTRPFPDFSFKISVNLWWRLKSSRSSSKPLLLPNTNTVGRTWVSTLLWPSHETSGGARSPVVRFDEVVLHQDLVDSHHQDGVDIVLGTDAGSHRELSRLVLVKWEKKILLRLFFAEDTGKMSNKSCKTDDFANHSTTYITICNILPHCWYQLCSLSSIPCTLKLYWVAQNNCVPAINSEGSPGGYQSQRSYNVQHTIRVCLT